RCLQTVKWLIISRSVYDCELGRATRVADCAGDVRIRVQSSCGAEIRWPGERQDGGEGSSTNGRFQCQRLVRAGAPMDHADRSGEVRLERAARQAAVFHAWLRWRPVQVGC